MSDPVEIQFSARDLLNNLKLALGDKHREDYFYGLVHARFDQGLISQRIANGWEIVLYDVPGGGGNGDTFVLMGRPRTPDDPPR